MSDQQLDIGASPGDLDCVGLGDVGPITVHSDRPGGRCRCIVQLRPSHDSGNFTLLVQEFRRVCPELAIRTFSDERHRRG